MPSAQDLLRAGQLQAAMDAVSQELRTRPTDTARRTFLFELTAFSGNWDRALKQLDVLATGGQMAEAGTLLYRAAIGTERVREHMFATGDFPTTPAPGPVSGTLDGRPFTAIEDADPRVGARLEVFAGGRYLWLPFAHLAWLRVAAPVHLRDVRWPTARLGTGPSVRDLDLGEVVLPALSPFAWRQEDPELRLGRATDWEEITDGEHAGDWAPVGQKVLRVSGGAFDDDGTLVPLLEVRDLVIAAPLPPAPALAS
jgi:type VI secretion system protein ImpE